MFKQIKIVLSKELYKVFKDPKMIFSLFILPVLLGVGMYALIGVMVNNVHDDIEQHKAIVSIENMPEELESYMGDYMEANQVTLTEALTQEEVEKNKDNILNGKQDLYVVFPDDFMESIEKYNLVPDIATYYNPSEDYSEKARDDFLQILNGDFYSDMLKKRLGTLSVLNIFTVDATNTENVIIDTNKASGQVIAQMFPYLIVMLLFAGTMSLGSDMIAGEKERGTMASLLLTPVSRMSIALGKMFALTIMSVLSALVYIVALLVTMPLSIGAMGGTSDMKYSMNVEQVLMIAAIMIILAFLYVSIVSICSVFAKTIKEASTYIMPIYILVIVAGMMTMFSTGNHQEVEYLIPVYNSALALGEIFTGDLTLIHFIMTIGMNFVVGLILSKCVATAFNSEKVMFGK